MKTILCYGDSNTWGFEPVTRNRYGRTERWTGILRQELGLDYDVIEEGLNGRTTVWDDPIEGHKNGKEQIIPILKSHQPLDLVTIMLGTNDLKRRFGLGALEYRRRSRSAGRDGPEKRLRTWRWRAPGLAHGPATSRTIERIRRDVRRRQREITPVRQALSPGGRGKELRIF